MSNLIGGRPSRPVNSPFTVNQSSRSSSGSRWAVILAGGDGTRLRSLTRMIAGDERPKQFCKILGDETLLDQTRRRAALAVPPAQTLFVLTQSHELFYDAHLGGVQPGQLVVQPKNAGTTPAILYSLRRLARVAPSSSVAFFPSDHYISDDEAFTAHVESAFAAAHAREDMVILLGIKPEGPEGEYGWIEPGETGFMENHNALSRVRRFWEKPAPALARTLMSGGCLWNSFVMVGRVSAFLKMIHRASPELFNRFARVAPDLNTPREEEMIGKLYSGLGESNFSKEVLAARPEDLGVLSVAGLRWSDLGRPQRVLSTMAEVGLLRPRPGISPRAGD